MELSKDISKSSDLTQLSNEITYRRYAMTRINMKNFFRDLTISDYIVLAMAAGYGADDGKAPQKLYLKDIAAKMELPINQISQVVGNLEGRGLVRWTHDGNGSEGTYISVTEDGKQMLEQEGEGLRAFYKRVIDRFGREEFIELLQMMKKLDIIMKEEIKEGGFADES